MVHVVLLVLFLTVLAVCVGIAGFALLAQAVTRYREADAQVEEILTDTLPGPAPLKAIRDVEPGINLALADECARLFNMPEREPGPERLRAAIRREQQKGEQA
jgi:hypothetical protein